MVSTSGQSRCWTSSIIAELSTGFAKQRNILVRGDFARSLECAAKAAAVYVRHHRSLPMRFEHELGAIPTAATSREPVQREGYEESATWVGELVGRIGACLTLLTRGVDLAGLP